MKKIKDAYDYAKNNIKPIAIGAGILIVVLAIGIGIYKLLKK